MRKFAPLVKYIDIVNIGATGTITWYIAVDNYYNELLLLLLLYSLSLSIMDTGL